MLSPKNPKLNQMKAGALATLTIGTAGITTAITTGIVDSPIPIAGIENRAQAQSLSVNVNVDFPWLLDKIRNMASNFWRNYYASSYLQTYFAHFEPSQVEQIKRQYGSSANSFFHNQCKDGFYRASNAQWWQKGIVDPFGWFFFVHREEDGRVNCYVRYPR
ncbi:MAG: hypothetical protein HEQ25_17770 [Dolichospermum sp. DET73]|jgi:hypothetical protein|nr:hypothetical protein [Dolichospermum sp. DET73]